MHFTKRIQDLILLEDPGTWHEEGFRERIASVDSIVVVPEEVLSNSLYYYDIRDKAVRIMEA